MFTQAKFIKIKDDKRNWFLILPNGNRFHQLGEFAKNEANRIVDQLQHDYSICPYVFPLDRDCITRQIILSFDNDADEAEFILKYNDELFQVYMLYD